MPSFWTDTRVAVLTQLWDQGHSASMIARALGATSNQVIGKAHRLNLSKRESPILRQPNVSARVQARLFGKGQRSGCEYIEDGYECGAARDGRSPYCAAHRDICSTGIPGKKRAPEPWRVEKKGRWR